MGRREELIAGINDNKIFYCKNYVSENDKLLFEMTYATNKLSIFTLILGIILDILIYSVFGPREHQYIIGIGKLNIYVLYLGKYHTIPAAYEAKPKNVQIINMSSIKEINIKKLFLDLHKLSIFTGEGNLIFYIGISKLEKEYLKNIQLNGQTAIRISFE